jgi:glycerophosphoryl diester phosphodiesterase
VDTATPINRLTFAELQHYDVGRLRPGSDYARQFPRQQPLDGTRIPRLADLFQLTRANRTLGFNIEPKMDADALDETLPATPFARALIAEVRKAGVQNRTTVQAFHWPLLKVVEREAPEMATVYCTEGEGSDPALVHAAGGKIWSPDYQTLTPARIAAARKWGMKITVWTVNEPADIARVIDMGVDGIASDYPDRVLEQLKGPQ